MSSPPREHSCVQVADVRDVRERMSTVEAENKATEKRLDKINGTEKGSLWSIVTCMDKKMGAVKTAIKWLGAFVLLILAGMIKLVFGGNWNWP